MDQALGGILRDTAAAGFTMASEAGVGGLLATLAASKPGGSLLEIGTGTGHGTWWLLSGMSKDARLDTVDSDAAVVSIARRHLDADTRVRFHVMDGSDFIAQSRADRFDLIYADAWPGKFTLLGETLSLLRAGGIYIVDDLLPQPNWPDGHAAKVPPLIDAIERFPGLTTVRMDWASGLLIAVRGR